MKSPNLPPILIRLISRGADERKSEKKKTGKKWREEMSSDPRPRNVEGEVGGEKNKGRNERNCFTGRQ